MLSFAASNLKDNDEGLLRSPGLPNFKLLPSILIYGANASGKTNVVQALHWLQSCVLHSHTQDNPRGIPRRPFALDKESASRPTSMEIDFIVNDVRYNFGFEATDTAFVREWLNSYPRGRQVELYSRQSEREVEFKRALRGKNRLLSELMRPDSLFLSVAKQNNHEQLTEIHDAIQSITFESHISVSDFLVGNLLEGDEAKIDRRTIEFLRKIGTGVEDYRAKEEAQSELALKLQADLASLLKKHLPESGALEFKFSEVERKIELGHRSFDKDIVFFELGWESSGTRRLLMLLAAIFRALDSGTTLVIDEIDASLHTQICEAIIALFADPSINKRGAQLLATTHDTNLMRSHHLRRDQLWFTEKTRSGETYVYPLTDIRTRSTDNLEKGYLQGRFGAIPFSGSTRQLLT